MKRLNYINNELRGVIRRTEPIFLICTPFSPCFPIITSMLKIYGGVESIKILATSSSDATASVD